MNETVRRAARIAGVPLWKIALQVGISEATLTRWMRVPLSDEREQRLLTAIFALTGCEEAEKESKEVNGSV